MGSAGSALDGLCWGRDTRSGMSTSVLSDEGPAPLAPRRVRSRCAPGSTGRTREEGVWTRTTVLPMQTHQRGASVGTQGLGPSREEWRRAKAAIPASLPAHDVPAERTLVRLDGHAGTGSVVSEVADCSSVTRGNDDQRLDRADIRARVHVPADQHLSCPRCAGSAVHASMAQSSAWAHAPTRAQHGGHPSRSTTEEQEASGWAHVLGHRLGTLRDHAAPACLHRLCRGLPLASLAARLPRLWNTKTSHTNRIAGGVPRPRGTKPGRWWGSRTWNAQTGNGGTRSLLKRCAPPRVRRPSLHTTSTSLHLRPHRPLPWG